MGNSGEGNAIISCFW